MRRANQRGVQILPLSRSPGLRGQGTVKPGRIVFSAICLKGVCRKPMPEQMRTLAAEGQEAVPPILQPAAMHFLRLSQPSRPA